MEDALGDSPATAFIVTALAFAIPFLRAASAATSTSVSAAAPTSLGATTVVSETLPLVVEATATLEIGEGCLNGHQRPAYPHAYGASPRAWRLQARQPIRQ